MYTYINICFLEGTATLVVSFQTSSNAQVKLCVTPEGQIH